MVISHGFLYVYPRVYPLVTQEAAGKSSCPSSLGSSKLEISNTSTFPAAYHATDDMFDEGVRITERSLWISFNNHENLGKAPWKSPWISNDLH